MRIYKRFHSEPFAGVGRVLLVGEFVGDEGTRGDRGVRECVQVDDGAWVYEVCDRGEF